MGSLRELYEANGDASALQATEAIREMFQSLRAIEKRLTQSENNAVTWKEIQQTVRHEVAPVINNLEAKDCASAYDTVSSKLDRTAKQIELRIDQKHREYLDAVDDVRRNIEIEQKRLTVDSQNFSKEEKRKF